MANNEIVLKGQNIICIVGTDRIFKKVNQAMCTLLGYTEAELLTMSIDALIHADDLDESLDRMQRFITGEVNSLYFENRYISKTGKVLHLGWTVTKGLEEGLLFCIARDISEKKELETAANRFLTERNMILESIGDAFFSVDKDWIVQYWNNVAEKVLQTPKEHIVGKHLWSVFNTSIDTVSYKKYNEAITTCEVKHFEDYYEQLDRWYDISAYPSDSGLSVFFKDITERKRIEQEIKMQGEALAIQNQKLKEISWMQSHIIRAPLARIMGLVELMNSTSPNNEETAEIINYIKLSANELDEVIRAIIASANEQSKL